MNLVGMPQQPAAILAGHLLVVAPTSEQRLTARQWTMLDLAMLDEAEGRPDLALAGVRMLEASLGTHEAHHEALVHGVDTYVAKIRTQKRRARQTEMDRARSLNLPLKAPPITETLDKLADEADEARREALRLQGINPKQHKHRIAGLLAEAVRLDAIVAEGVTENEDGLWLYWANKETRRLAEDRGETVATETLELAFPITDAQGVTRRHTTGPNRGKSMFRFETVTLMAMKSRGGGLSQAHTAGHLNGAGGRRRAWELLVVGAMYQRAFETMDPLRASGGGEGGGGGGEGPQVAACEAGQLLEVMRRDLSVAQVEILNWVCGQDRTLRDKKHAAGGQFETHRSNLRHSLELVAANLQQDAKDCRSGRPRRRARLAGGV